MLFDYGQFKANRATQGLFGQAPDIQDQMGGSPVGLQLPAQRPTMSGSPLQVPAQPNLMRPMPMQSPMSGSPLQIPRPERQRPDQNVAPPMGGFGMPGRMR